MVVKGYVHYIDNNTLDAAAHLDLTIWSRTDLLAFGSISIFPLVLVFLYHAIPIVPLQSCHSHAACLTAPCAIVLKHKYTTKLS
jgi:hypothetical protein